METKYRQLGRTGVQVSPLCLGCMAFGTRADEATSARIIDHAIEHGINFLDTANAYGRGASEAATGRALERNGKRDQVVLATKVHNPMSDSDPNASGSSRRHILEQCDASLRRLRTDYIDLYQVHRPRPDTPIDETLRALDDLIRAGKVRYAGTSTFAAWQLVESLWVAKELGLNRFVCEQPPYNLLDRRIERELLPMAETYGFAVIPWSPLAGGLLTGKYLREGEPPAGTRYAGVAASTKLQSRMNARAFDVIERLTPLAAAKGCSLSQFALAWCMSSPGITAPIIGPRTLDQLHDNLAAVKVSITAADRAAIDELIPPGLMVAPFYDADFGPHRYRW